MKRDIKSDYRGWRFLDKVPLISRDEQWKSYFDSKFSDIDVDVDIDTDGIVEDVADALKDILDDELCCVHKHIEDAKKHLCCDICHAKNDIKSHIDEKIEPIMQFEEQFSDLNEQVQTIIGLLNE